MVISLKKIISLLKDDEVAVRETLSSFQAAESVSKHEVETFLQRDAYRQEKHGQSATYLIFNDELLQRNEYSIDGYFSIAIRALKLGNEVSNSWKKRMIGQKVDCVPSYLIGQLAKGVDTPAGIGSVYFQTAISYIKRAASFVGGNLVYLDCDDALVPYYEKKSFKYLQKNENGTLNQMYATIDTL